MVTSLGTMKVSRKKLWNTTITEAKAEAHEDHKEEINLVNSYRHYKNRNANIPRYTFNIIRVTSIPSRIDYILKSEQITNKAEQLDVKFCLRADFNPDNDYLELSIYKGNARQSRS